MRLLRSHVYLLLQPGVVMPFEYDESIHLGWFLKDVCDFYPAISSHRALVIPGSLIYEENRNASVLVSASKGYCLV